MIKVISSQDIIELQALLNKNLEMGWKIQAIYSAKSYGTYDHHYAWLLKDI